jgi:uncharacterized membrane protein
MHWLLGIVFGLLGALFGEASGLMLGLALGFALGWQGVRIADLRRRIAVLEREREALPAAPVPAPASPPRPTPPMSQGAPIASPEFSPEASAESTPAREPTAADTDLAIPAFTTAAPRPAPASAARPPPRRRDTPPEPRPPNALAQTLRRWLFEGNLPVKFGVLVLFIGVASALKYAADQGYFALPIEFRLTGIALGAVVALYWGFRRRERQPAFGLSVQGGAIGVLLLTVFAAFRLYALITPLAALTLAVVIVAGAALLALLQNAIALAVLGFVGGYLAPVLISTGAGNHVALFSYYALLNAAVFAIAWFRRWRVLNLVGFAFTFAIGTAWGVLRYRTEDFATVEPFLILFFLFFSLIPVLHALRAEPTGRGFVDGTLVFGTPLLAFPLQAAMLSNDRMGLAYSALVVAAFYAVLAAWLMRRRDADLLARSHAALAIGFATIAIPLALSARWTLAAWAAEGAALVWLGLRQQRVLPQIAGSTLQLLAAMAYLVGLASNAWDRSEGELALLNGHALGTLIMAGSALFIAWLYERAGSERALIWIAFLWGALWWGVGGLREVAVWDTHVDWPAGLILFAAATLAMSGVLRGVLPWPRLGWFVVAAACAGPILAFASAVEFEGPLRDAGGPAWLVYGIALIVGLSRLRTPLARAVSLAHVAGLWTVAMVLGAQGASLAERELALGNGWIYLALLAPLAVLIVLTWRRPAIGAAPLTEAFAHYRVRWFVPAAVVLALGWLAGLLLDGDASPLPFLPLLNPLELKQLSLLLLALSAALALRGAWIEAAIRVLPIAGFLFASAATLRAVHQLTRLPWSPSLLDSNLAQTSLTVVWSVLGVTAWVYGSRRQRWPVWLAGAIIMGVVLAKLVLIDRGYVGNLAGIVSFLAVGALLVIVGRIAPTPPRHAPEGSP